MQTIFLVRHGETQWNAELRFQGKSDIGLNEEGFRQSRLLAKRLEKEKIDMAYSSPLERALQTAEIITEPHNLSIITHSGLSERSHGAVEGMTKDEFREKYPKVWEEYEKTRELPGIKGIETVEQSNERCTKAFIEIVKSNPGRNILIVAHGGANKGIIHELTGKDYMKFHQHNCCLNIIKYDGRDFVFEKIDDISHLETEAY
jgi:alpha-ribazole phosphatase/probable phosphoglycerate mutase